MSRERFVQFIQEGIVALPNNLKAVLRVVEDGNLPDEGRAAAAGALLHWLSSSNAIPGARGLLQYVDDVLVMSLTLESLRKEAPEAMVPHEQDEPELFGELDANLAATRAYLGPSVCVLEKAAAAAHNLKLKGHTARHCALHDESSTWLYDEVQAALVDFEVEEDEVARAVRGIDGLIEPLRQRFGHGP